MTELDLLWSGYVVDTPGCKLPSYDAYHPTINRQARKPPYNYETYCNKTKPTKSRSYLIEERNAFEFLAYNKVGINSFPNLIPLLSGVSGTDFENLFREIYYDNAPLVFNVYKSLNYTTLFLEEMPLQSIFRARGSFGFKNAPTDYYPVPMMFIMDRLHYKNKFCMGSRLKTKEILKYTSDILIMNRDHPMFAYVFLAYITHDTTSDLGYLDGLLEEFFRGLGTAGVLDRTVVLFFSDHGMRFGSAVRTKIGRHEDKTPFCLWVFPRGFLAEHPEAAVWLEVNQRRLVTTYDFHATLLSIASLPALQTKPTNKGISLMSRVPPERTCEDAFIPYAFCACDGAEKKLNDTSIGLSFAGFAIAYINAQAEANFPGKCVTWALETLIEATSFGSGVTGKVEVRISFRTVPTAYFDVYGSIEGEHRYVDYVDRTDSYRSTTTCLNTSNWEKVCKCKETV
ncbi:uncharacterized protein LOC144168321 [Haemaphysalis longicornis]